MSPIEMAQFVGIPVAVATVLVFLSWAMTTTNRREPMGAIVALGIASFIAFVLQEGIPTLPPAQKWHWLILSLFAVWALACIYPCFKKWDELIVLQAIIAGILVSVLMQFPAQQDLLFRVLIFVMVLFVSLGLRRVTVPAWHMYLVVWMLLAGISILALQASFAKLAFFTGAMSAVSAALCVLQLWKPRVTKSIQMVLGVIVVGSSMCGFAYDQGEAAQRMVWFLPLLSVPFSALAYLLLTKKKYGALVSLGTVVVFIAFAVLWSLYTTPIMDDEYARMVL